MRVLVTGGTSLVGGHVATRLKERGDEVVLFQRAEGPSRFQQRRGNITDAGAVTAAVAGVDAIIHMAAKVGIVGPWSEYLETNVNGTKNVLAAAQAESVNRFVYVSSPSVAHTGQSLVGAGAAPADPHGARGHYARSKAMAEVAALAASSTSLPVVAVRPHLIWGPGDTQLVGRMVERAKDGKLATVGSGLALIDTTYVTNAADAIVAALDRAPEVEGQSFVVSNGQPRTVIELVRRIVAAAGLEPPRLKVPYRVAKAGGIAAERLWDKTQREGDPPMTSFLAEQLATAHWFDQRTTRAALQWEPAVSIEEGFGLLARWFANN